MNSDSENKTRAPMTAAMRSAFEANAPTALRRRSNGYILSMATNVGQWLVISGVALIGLYHWGWTPTHLLLVFVAGIVVATVADAVKWLLARRSMLADYQKMRDDRLVWQIVTARQWGREDIEAEKMQRPGAAIAMDLVLGAIGVWLLLAQLRAMGVQPSEFLAAASGLRGALIAVCIAPLISLASSLAAGNAEDGAHDDLEFRAGGRGISLIFLATALWILGNKPDAARSLMLFINGATVFLGVIGIFGVWIMYRQREWLRAHLRTTDSAKSRIEASPTDGDPKRRRRNKADRAG
ncbi:MAG: hypothetical protein SGI99_17160 [Pseudomonadota bacterium]|nr:hypothetical protein [Pseudomonadota bacterium]